MQRHFFIAAASTSRNIFWDYRTQPLQPMNYTPGQCSFEKNKCLNVESLASFNPTNNLICERARIGQRQQCWQPHPVEGKDHVCQRQRHCHVRDCCRFARQLHAQEQLVAAVSGSLRQCKAVQQQLDLLQRQFAALATAQRHFAMPSQTIVHDFLILARLTIRLSYVWLGSHACHSTGNSQHGRAVIVFRVISDLFDPRRRYQLAHRHLLKTGSTPLLKSFGTALAEDYSS
ncbi:hypothetical protein DFH08DRAFT_1033802 [Mycena albidolilacea]|uniref:Uncharacterized protein n=1 Tax=Mycena albidolilacea TaxID=1033008 RepID=A0AAD6ZFX3_9AGAR|nr:hypothetical protein DFH08DRAFT_1033802 [Mycena albidolilacea]